MATNDPFPPSLQISSENITNLSQPTCQSRSLYITLPASNSNDDQNEFSLTTTDNNEVTNADSTANVNTSNNITTQFGGSNERSTTQDNQSQSCTLTTLQQQQSYQPSLEVELPPQPERL